MLLFLKNLFGKTASEIFIQRSSAKTVLFLLLFSAAGCGEKMYTGLGWCVERSECGKAGLNCIAAVKTFSPNQNSAQDQLLAFCATRETSCRDWCERHCAYAKGSWCYTEKYHLIPK